VAVGLDGQAADLVIILLSQLDSQPGRKMTREGPTEEEVGLLAFRTRLHHLPHQLRGLPVVQRRERHKSLNLLEVGLSVLIEKLILEDGLGFVLVRAPDGILLRRVTSTVRAWTTTRSEPTRLRSTWHGTWT